MKSISSYMGPGILLNPILAQNPSQLPAAFSAALRTKRTDVCALRDELGAIADSMYARERVERTAGASLFAILESERTLKQAERDIARDLSRATPAGIRRAVLRSRRYRVRSADEIKRMTPRHDDEQLAWELLNAESQAEAARRLGYTRGRICRRIAAAPYESPLALFQGAFGIAGRRHTEHEIAALLDKGLTLTTAANKLGYAAAASILMRIKRADGDSPLAKFKKRDSV